MKVLLLLLWYIAAVSCLVKPYLNSSKGFETSLLTSSVVTNSKSFSKNSELSLRTVESSVLPNFGAVKPKFPLLRDAQYVSPCSSGNSEVPNDFSYGWRFSDNTGFGWVIGDMINDLANQASGNTRSFTFFTQRGGLKCGVWSGAMVSNGDTFKILAGRMVDNVRNEDIPTGKYFEYIGSNPMQTFGVYCQVNSNSDDAATAVRGWSENISASKSVPDIKGTAKLGRYSICYTSYANRKQGNKSPDGNVGKCNSVSINQGQTASGACNVPGDSLSYYNLNMDFTKLNAGDYVCCSIGDGSALPKNTQVNNIAKCNNGNSQLVKQLSFGWQGSGVSSYSWVIADMVQDISNKFVKNTNDWTEFTQRGGLKCGSWIGSMISNDDTSKSVFPIIIDNIKNEGISTAKYFEYLGDNPMQTFGIYCSANGNLDDVSAAVRGWSQGKTAMNSVNGLSGTNQLKNTALCFRSYQNRKSGNTHVDGNLGQCNYNRVSNGQTASDACNGLTGDVLSSYNPKININVVQPQQPICCSMGTMPDFRPKRTSDGSCFVYTFNAGATCSQVFAQYYPLSLDDLMNYNKNTFGWLGCSNGHPWKDDKICLSDGTPPRPAVNPQAECGPQAPGDKYNKGCPLNACCSEYGFCGLTDEFCKTKSSLTNAPGTTGCLSNCNTPGFSNSPASSWTRVAYFDGSKQTSIADYGDEYDVIHLAFANVAKDHASIDTSNIKDSFSKFSKIKAKKMLSIGGWDFSTDTSTYSILRDAIENDYDHFANVIVSFMQQPQNAFLDGFDIDWEYPGAPDIPGIPADSKDAGQKYYELIKAVRLRMDRSKTLSIAIPSSYWYLKNYPIKDMMEYLDYVIFMSYDLHGQWDYGQKYGVGPYTKCHTDLQETEDVLKMLIKAGVPANKVRVGTANYARTYQLTDSSCNGVKCEFTGPASGATPGPDTKTPGVLSITEIRQIVAQKRQNNEFNDAASDCTVMRYDNNQWAAWTTENSHRESLYKSWGFGGSSLWVANYEPGTTKPSDNNNENNNNENNDDYDEEDDNNIDVDSIDINTSLNNVACWNNVKNIKTEQAFNDSSSDCGMEATIAYLLNAGTDAINYLEPIVKDIDNKNSDYNKDYAGFAAYFSKNMSFAYQEWAYTNIDNENWFSCLNTQGDSVGCGYALKHDFKPTCHKQCCPDIGCLKRVKIDGKQRTVNDDATTNGACKTAGDSFIPECCENNYNVIYPTSFKRSTIESDNSTEYMEIQKAILENTKKVLMSGEYDMGQPTLEGRDTEATGHLFRWIIKSNQAFESFTNYMGYRVTPDTMYRQAFYRFQQKQKNDAEGICWKDQHNNVTVRCFDMPIDSLFINNPLDNLNMTFITNIKDIINKGKTSMDNNDDYYSNIHDSIQYPLSSLLDLVDTVKIIRQIGHNYESRCRLLRVMEILGPLIEVLGILTIFLGPLEAVIANLALSLINAGVNPDSNVGDMVMSLVGAGSSIIKPLGRTGKGSFRSADSFMDVNNALHLAQRTLKVLKSKQIDDGMCDLTFGN